MEIKRDGKVVGHIYRGNKRETLETDDPQLQAVKDHLTKTGLTGFSPLRSDKLLRSGKGHTTPFGPQSVEAIITELSARGYQVIQD